MINARLRLMTVGFLVLAMPFVARATAAEMVQSASQISAADAAPFLGEWTLELQGPNGPGTFTLSIRVDKETEKVVGEIASESTGKTPISTMSLADKNLVLNYSFTWEGNPVDAVVSLSPEKEGKSAAQIDFAGGAYVMTGTATKNDRQKAEKEK